MTTGEYLRAARAAQGLSLRAAAAASGMSFSHLCDVEHGRRDISESAAVALCAVYGASPARALALGGRITAAAASWIARHPHFAEALHASGTADGKG
jgi:transcriptional regulator with XRE-family HTH domain